jgi:sarcosine oxidase subunit gamma
MPDLTALRRVPEICSSTAVRALAPAARYVLRGADEVRVAAERALGVALPASPCRAGIAAKRAALWLGPDEWLLIGPEAASDELAALLGGALQGLPHSLVDVSHRQCALTVSGPAAATLLAAGCPLDLDASTFPVGMCTRTTLAKAEIVLWRTEPEVFRVEVWRSFSTYVSQFLAEAARGII